MDSKNWQGKESQFHLTKHAIHDEEKQENEKKIIKSKEKYERKILKANTIESFKIIPRKLVKKFDLDLNQYKKIKTKNYIIIINLF